MWTVRRGTKTPAVEFYVDFEYCSDLDDDFAKLPEKGGQSLIFMIGCGHMEEGEWRFKSLVTECLSLTEEAQHNRRVDRAHGGGLPTVESRKTASLASFTGRTPKPTPTGAPGNGTVGRIAGPNWAGTISGER